jgi:hypothetical protein
LEESAREERATNGGRGGKKLADLVDFDEWADANMGGMMPMAGEWRRGKEGRKRPFKRGGKGA